MRYWLGVLAVVLALFIVDRAEAVNKSATLVPPADYTTGGWSIRIEPQAGPGQAVSQWCAITNFCAFDAAQQATDCKSQTVCVATPPADVIAFVNARLAAAKAANGY